ncbi:branched-chain amino acid aminotransferase [Schleiferia thermophila]|jgi:branched-chain amino acid aminotransferase|uniref:branched-chain-amino-acid transaminase n=1 Tax=Schleiferia thermophila TaxID=884107 RepID=A0A369A1R4_9FLAO|nr:branched-chain amino acid aminotransferase [Schleiferia thermophila]GCD80264.1 aminotransferase class IV [Schleiferia thermophila]
MVYNFNGSLLESKQIELPVDNRALLYGDGVFETIRYSYGKLLFWEDHYFRLMASLRIIRIRIPVHWTPEYLRDQIHETLEANHLEKQPARVRLTVWRKPGGRYLPDVHDPEFLITCHRLISDEYEAPENKVTVDIYRDIFKPANLLSNLKLIGSQLYVMASIFADENGLYDALLINDAKQVVESSKSNLFALYGTEVVTPPLTSGALRGVIRQRLLKALPDIGLKAVEKDLTPFDLLKADELWLTNAIVGIVPVHQYRSKEYSTLKALAALRLLNELARQDTFDLSF